MQKKEIYELADNDYSKSANTLFHFMKNSEFLKKILQKKAIVPRYCKEDIGYLNIRAVDTFFQEVAILQKCFAISLFISLQRTLY